MTRQTDHSILASMNSDLFHWTGGEISNQMGGVEYYNQFIEKELRLFLNEPTEPMKCTYIKEYHNSWPEVEVSYKDLVIVVRTTGYRDQLRVVVRKGIEREILSNIVHKYNDCIRLKGIVSYISSTIQSL